MGLFSVVLPFLFFFSFLQECSPSVKVSASLSFPASLCPQPLCVWGSTKHILFTKIFIQHIFENFNLTVRFSAGFEYQAALFRTGDSRVLLFTDAFSSPTKVNEIRRLLLLCWFNLEGSFAPALGFQVFFCRLSLLLTTLYWTLKCFVFTFAWFLLVVQSGAIVKYKVPWESYFPFIWNFAVVLEGRGDHEEGKAPKWWKAAEMMRVCLWAGQVHCRQLPESDMAQNMPAFQSIYLSTSVGSEILTIIPGIHLNSNSI